MKQGMLYTAIIALAIVMGVIAWPEGPPPAVEQPEPRLEGMPLPQPADAAKEKSSARPADWQTC